MYPITQFLDTNYFHSSNRITALEGIRGWAVLMVFNTHFFLRYAEYDCTVSPPTLIRYFQFLQQGHCGVDLFFLLSGFFIYKSLQKSHGFLFFMARRYERILPVLVLTNMSYFIHKMRYKDLIDNVFYLKIFQDSAYFNWVTWSITYEIYFYILAGIMGIVFRQYLFHIWVFLVLILLAILIDSQFPNVALHRFSTFFWGMLIAKTYDTYWYSIEKYVNKLFIPALILMVYLRFRLEGEERGYFLLEYLGLQLGFIMLVLSTLANNRWALFIFTWKPLRFIGNISFSFYVIHGIWGLSLAHSFTNLITQNEINTLKFISHYIVGLGLTTCLATFLYYYLEKPYFSNPIISIKNTPVKK